MKTLHISVEDQNLYEFVLNRDSIPFTKTGDSYEIDCSEEDIVILHEDVDCEKQRASTKHHTPVYSYKTFLNPEKLGRLMKLNNKRCFQILAKDQKDYLANFQ